MTKFRFVICFAIALIADLAMANPDSIKQKIDAYISQAKFDSAKMYIQSNLADAKQSQNISDLNYQLVKVLFIQSNYDEALKQAYHALDNISAKSERVNFNFMIGCIYSAISDYSKSIGPILI